MRRTCHHGTGQDGDGSGERCCRPKVVQTCQTPQRALELQLSVISISSSVLGESLPCDWAVCGYYRLIVTQSVSITCVPGY